GARLRGGGELGRPSRSCRASGTRGARAHGVCIRTQHAAPDRRGGARGGSTGGGGPAEGAGSSPGSGSGDRVGSRLSLRAEILGDEPVEDAVDPLLVPPVRLAAHTFADEPG